jgi:hypothetical protein
LPKGGKLPLFALRAEKKSKEKGLSVRLIPVPRHLSSDCEVCLRIPWEANQTIKSLLEMEGVKMEGVHPLKTNEK